MSSSSSDGVAIVHLNHAGASPSPPQVQDRVWKHLQLERELGGYAAQDVVVQGHGGGGKDDDDDDDDNSESLPSVYANVAQLIHAPSPSCIALVESATVGWTRAFYSMVQQQSRMNRKKRKERTKSRPQSDGPTNVILISEADYAANVVAACQWARDHSGDGDADGDEAYYQSWTVLHLPSSRNADGSSSGIVDVCMLDQMLSGQYRYKRRNPKDGQEEETLLDPNSISLVAITHVPTNSGIVNPVVEIGERIAAHNEDRRRTNEDGEVDAGTLFYLVDACQSIGQLDVNVQHVQCHALVATGRKYLRAPRGTGFLYVAESALMGGDNKDDSALRPSHVDHYGTPVTAVPTTTGATNVLPRPVESMVEFGPRPGAKRFEFWESNVAARLGLGEAVQYALNKGLPVITTEIESLSASLRKKLEQMPRDVVQIHHPATSTCGIVTFQCLNVDPYLVKDAMWTKGFALSVVPATSTPLDSAETNVPDLVRASVSYINTEEELVAFCEALKEFLEA